MIRIGIIEDDLLFLHALMGYIGQQPGMITVGSASDIPSGIRFGLREENLDVLLVDCCLEQSVYDGIQVIQEIREKRKGPPLKYIFLTSVEDQDVILKAYTAGASRYLLKSDYQDLVSVIHNVMKDGPNPINTLLEEYRRLVEEQTLSALTAAERDVFAQLKQGKNRMEIVETLGKTEDTIKTQIKSILRKLHVSSTKEAIDKVKRGGL
ncbi:response regulator transcription factor [Gorillibacterium sp. sgz5001074]|uniref:response regulator transcription factor n=1 Tax=Gorillibacterium sp. sgz5001074 TaxID=3446695 RepID=UPI003F677309